MNLYIDLLKEILKKEEIQVSFPNLEFCVEEIVNQEIYQLLQRIVDIVRDSNLDDPECFSKIEEIVCVLEKSGISAGPRHDFG